MRVSSTTIGLTLGLIGTLPLSLGMPLVLALAGKKPWNFPGDGDLVTFSTLLALMAIAVTGAAAWRMGPGDGSDADRPARPVMTILCLSHLVVLTLLVAMQLERLGPRWSEVRHGIQRYAQQVDAATGGTHRLLRGDEFETLRKQFMPEPIPVSLPGHGVVHLRMAHGIYPYVGVDFGGGSHALFDPVSMFVLYTD